MAKHQLGDVLDEAKQIITGERQDSYGNPEDSFTLIGNFWGTYLGIELTPRQVADMMVLFKVARLKGQKPTRDTYRDIVGYAGIAADKMLDEGEPAGEQVVEEPGAGEPSVAAETAGGARRLYDELAGQIPDSIFFGGGAYGEKGSLVILGRSLESEGPGPHTRATSQVQVRPAVGGSVSMTVSARSQEENALYAFLLDALVGKAA